MRIKNRAPVSNFKGDYHIVYTASAILGLIFGIPSSNVVIFSYYFIITIIINLTFILLEDFEMH